MSDYYEEDEEPQVEEEDDQDDQFEQEPQKMDKNTVEANDECSLDQVGRTTGGGMDVVEDTGD